MIALIFDTETTGFKSSTFNPEIVQIGAVLQDTEGDRRVLGELNVIIKPQNPIPEKVSAIHGITDELAAKFGISSPLAEATFVKFLMMADVVVAHNIEFDLQMIECNWSDAHTYVKNAKQFCTMREAVDIIKMPRGSYHGSNFGQYKPPKLIEAYQHFFDGKSFENAHDAMADVRACRDVYFALQEAITSGEQ